MTGSCFVRYIQMRSRETQYAVDPIGFTVKSRLGQDPCVFIASPHLQAGYCPVDTAAVIR